MYNQGERKYTGENEWTQRLNTEGKTTPYRHITLLMQGFIEKYPQVSETFPSRGPTAACREYDVLGAVDFLSPFKWKATTKSEETQAYFQKLLDWTIENEAIIASALTRIGLETWENKAGETCKRYYHQQGNIEIPLTVGKQIHFLE